ncbi:MAG: TonB-dependent siderophore receptor [Alcaligenes aquatilis]
MSGYSPPIAARKASPSPATPVFQPRFRQTPLACLIQLAVASSALGLGTWHTQAQAEPLRLAQAASPSTQNYNIPAGPLSTALARFASASGVLVAGAGELAKGKSSPGAFGTLSPRAALDALLAGTDLTAVPSSDGSYSLRKMPQVPAPANEVTQLGTVTVRAQQANPLTEGTGSYTTTSMSTATRLNLSSRETPQSVSVITRQQLDDYNVNTLRDVMRYTPGMYVVESEGVADEYAFQARGFGVDNLMIDGQATDRTNFNMRTISADMNMYDRVEVLRGAAGLLYGVGAPSAAVNLVRKRPTADPLLNLAVGVGSHDRYSATFDGGGAIGPTERVRGRLVGSYQNEHGFVDVSKSNNRSLYGVVELDLTEHTTLGLGASYQRYRANGIYSGKPSYLDGSPVDMPRSAFWGQAWSHQYRETATYFLDLNHEFDNGWKAKLAAMHTTGETDSVYPNIQRIANDPNRFKFDSTGWDYDTRQTNLEGTLSGTFPLLGRDHELVVGASYRKEFSKAGNPWEGGGTHILDPHNFNPNQTPDSGMTPTTNPMLWANRSENTGIFSTLRLNLADSTKLILGGRLGWYEQQGTGWYFGQRNWRKAVRQNAEFTPFAGIVQDLDDRHSVYASYAQIFQPQGAVDLNGKQLDPMTGTNLEIGIKGEYFDGALNTNLALYQIKQRNRAISDEENCPAGGPLSCSRAAGEIESKGVDVEISGALTPRWQVGGGYTFNLARYTKDSNPARIGQRLNNEVPRHLFKMFTNYRPGGQWHRWNVGASVYMQSPIEIDEGVFHAYQGTYAVVGLMAGYQVNSKLNLVLNVDNLFDRHYRTALGASWSGSNVRHGAPLNAMLRLEYKM